MTADHPACERDRTIRRTMLDKNEILDLITTAATGGPFRDAALATAERFRTAGDAGTSDRIRLLFENGTDLPPGLSPMKLDKTLEEIRLPEDAAEVVRDFMTEQKERDVLVAGGIEPRHKMLLVGPPGNGKTVLSKAIAHHLGYRAFFVRYDDLISKVPGETSRNLLRMFSYAALEPSVLFFDEFDALGRERDDAQESGEMKRVVSTLLVQLDDVPSNVVCLAATNHAKMLDPAIWRRFNIRLELRRPSLDDFPEFMLKLYRGYKLEPKIGEGPGMVDLSIAVYRMSLENLSDAELFCRNSVRTFLLAKGSMTIEQAIDYELENWGRNQKKRAL